MITIVTIRHDVASRLAFNVHGGSGQVVSGMQVRVAVQKFEGKGIRSQVL